MPPKPRQIKIEQKGALASMSKLETKSDEELTMETRHRAAAQAILGARAAERYDAKRAREHFKAAIAASRPQERLQLRRMAEASLALAERRADDLKIAAEKLGQTPPSSRQLFILRLMGRIAPPAGAPRIKRIGGIALLMGILFALLATGWGLAKLFALPFGGVASDVAIFYGVVIVMVALGGLAVFGRRKQKRMQAKALADRAERATRR